MMAHTTPNRRYDLLIFDWDGTLMDSVGQIVLAMQRAFQDMGLPERSPEQLRDLIGLGLNDVVNRLFPGVDPQRLRSWLSAYRQRYFSSASRALLFPTVRDTLTELQHDGYELTVATGKGRRGLEEALAHTGIGPFFSYTRCADESVPKPAPDMVDEILLRTATLAERALVVGDTEYDMLMARAAGVAAVGVSCGVHQADRLRASGAGAVLTSVAALPAWLAEQADTRTAAQPS